VQLPLAHCGPVWHAPPLATWGTQAAPEQNVPAAQLLAWPGGQLPRPSHRRAEINIPELHMALPQDVPETANRHAPPPQNPSRPHAVPDAVHSFAGSVPLRTGAQVPSAGWPVWLALHETQTPLHRLLQHTPSTQKPSKHSVGPAHGVPSPLSGKHALVVGSQYCPAPHG
jgi:hypothetical protein